MAQSLLANDTPMEFFRERLAAAMENQRVSASAFTEFYLVNLLTSCVRREVLPGPEPGFRETPLAVLYGRALQGPPEERTRRLRELGDTALFVSGYFPDSRLGRAVDHSYYRDLGGRAYAHLSNEERLAFGPRVFAELGRRFSQFADLLSEVSDSTLAVGHLEEQVVDRLAEQDPRRGLHRENLAAYCTLTEEVSHFVYLGYCASNGRLTTQLELELVGEVDKYLAAADLLSLQQQGALSEPLRDLLFRGYRLAEGLSPEQADRYHRASGFAERYCGFLEQAFIEPGRAAELHHEARRFYRLGRGEKLARIAGLD